MATNRVYVGNLPYDSDDQEIRAFFSGYNVTEVKIILDRETQRPRGFAFVQLESNEEVIKAVANLDGAELGGRTIKVSEAKERERGGGPGPGAPRRDTRSNGNGGGYNGGAQGRPSGGGGGNRSSSGNGYGRGRRDDRDDHHSNNGKDDYGWKP